MKKDNRIMKWFHSSSSKCFFMILAAFICLFALLVMICTPRRYDLAVGVVSHDTINATKDVIDEVTTQEKRTAAAAAVEPTYHFQQGVKEEVLLSLDKAFNELRNIQQYGVTLRSGENTRNPAKTFSEEEIDYAYGLSEFLTLTRFQITTMLRTDTAVFEDMVSTVTTAVENSLNATIREGQVNQAISTILQIVGYRVDVSLTQNILPTVLRTCILPNMTIDQVATDRARQNAMDSIEPIIYLQGQNIIREGERVTSGQLQMLRTLGLLNENTYDYSVYAGAGLITVLSVFILYLLLRLLESQLLSDVRKLAVVLLVFFIGSIISAGAFLLPSIFVMPVILGPILATVLIGTHAGICVAGSLTVFVTGLILGNGQNTYYDLLIMISISLIDGVVSVRFLKGHPQRIRVPLAGLLAAFVSVVIVMSYKMLSASEMSVAVSTSLWTAAGCFLSGVLAVALQPAFEAVFHLATPSRLLELTNPNQPLMRRLMIEAPGTYHHAVIVGNLSEAAAASIGANPYLARAGAYYHDIGKLKRPQYFKENQTGENPHEHTDPFISAAILTSHTKDGVLLAQKEHLPPEIQQIILQHHGVTPVMFFYHKALQLSDGQQVDINDFRYAGPKPKTKEAAIVMLADTIEAAVRSMKDPTPKSIDQFIERLIRGKLEDGQLSDSPLSLQDIDHICEAFSGILRGVYHERIEYPTMPRAAIQQKEEPHKNTEEEGKQEAEEGGTVS